MSEECPSLECGSCDRPLFDYSLNAFPTYYNEEQSFFVPCPVGLICTDDEGNIVSGVTIVVTGGTVSYTPTTAAENTPENVQEKLEEKGQQAAENQASQQQLFAKPKLFYNKAITLNCGEGKYGSFDPDIPFMTAAGVVTIPAGIFSSKISQEDADNKAGGTALQIFILFADVIQCHWKSAEVILECPEGAEGGPITVPFGHDISFISQQDADSKAIEYAHDQVPSVCTYWNDEQTVNCTPPETGGPFTVPAHTYSSSVSKAEANALALADAQAQADAGCTSCTDYPISGLVWTQGGVGVGSAAGGSGSGTVDQTMGVNAFITFQAQLPNSCNPYVMNIDMDYNLGVDDVIIGAPAPGVDIGIAIDGVQVAYDFINAGSMSGPQTKSGNFNVNHTIDVDAFETANGYHLITISARYFVPFGSSVPTTFNFDLTPLTPP